jgi:hypothetical protein
MDIAALLRFIGFVMGLVAWAILPTRLLAGE